MSGDDHIRLEASWKAALRAEFDAPYMQALRRFLAERKAARATVYPPGPEIFAALDSTPLPAVRVVVIGQDPYHGPGQAHGLSFSVRPGVAVPPSLRNIYAEITTDLSDPTVPGARADAVLPPGGHLAGWARQGVLLLNSVLTVERGRAGAHQGKGWEQFTDRIVEVLATQRSQLVFLLWGSYAQKKGAHIDRARHCVLTAPHPSPLSAHRGFLGCRHFSRANRYLAEHSLAPIDWFATDS